MSKCRPPCCPGNSSDNGAVIIVGLVVLALAIYGSIRAVWHNVLKVLHVLLAIVESVVIVAAGVVALVLLAVITVKVIRWRQVKRSTATAGYVAKYESKLVALDAASPPTIAASALGKPAQDPAELFAEAVANGMDPRFVERILNVALERHDQ